MIADKIPAWALRLILVVSLSISAAALFLTRTYAVGNLAMLGLDAETVFVRRLSIDVLLAAHVAALFIATVLPARYFRLQRWQLGVLAVAIWVFDGASIYQSRFGVMDSADQSQRAAAARLADQRAAIQSLQEQAAALRVTAARQAANKMITAGAETQKEAARLAAKAAAMAEQLAAMPSGVGTTEVRVWGWRAPYKAAIESALISFVSLIMLGLSGLMGRELLQASAGRMAQSLAPAAAPAKAPEPEKAAPVAPVEVQKPAPADEKHDAPALAPEPARPAFDFGFIPRQPAQPAQARHDAHDSGSVWHPPRGEYNLRAERPTLAPKPPAAPIAPQQVQADALVQVQEVQKRSAVVRKKVPAGLRDAIKAGEVRPAQKAIKVFAGCSQATAEAWLEQMGAEGLIERMESGRWRLKVAA